MSSFEFKCPECKNKYTTFIIIEKGKYQCQRCGNIFIIVDGKLKKVEVEE